MRLPARITAQVGRTLLLMIIAALGTILLVRFAPGFFSDVREMDPRYAQAARSELATDHLRESAAGIVLHELQVCLRGDFGQSRQFDVPVADLIGARIRVSALLLLEGIAGGWLLAICGALSASMVRRGDWILSLPFTILLAVPTAAMATTCILAETGGPVMVFSLLMAARESPARGRVVLASSSLRASPGAIASRSLPPAHPARSRSTPMCAHHAFNRHRAGRARAH